MHKPMVFLGMAGPTSRMAVGRGWQLGLAVSKY